MLRCRQCGGRGPLPRLVSLSRFPKPKGYGARAIVVSLRTVTCPDASQRYS
jgi:hypothetical protein